MTRYMIGLACWLVVVGNADADSFTVKTTPEQDKGLERLVARAAAQAAVNLKGNVSARPALTPQQIIQTIVTQQLDTLIGTDDRASACAKITDADAKKHFGCK